MSAEDSRLSSSWRDSPASGVAAEKEARERYCAGRGQLLSEPTEIRIEAADHDLHCPAVAWHAEPLFLDDAILDRLLNNAHPITLEGAPMRRLYDSTKSHSTT